MPASQTLPPENLRNVRRIVLLWIGRLGDFLITTPMLRAVRARFPKAEIVMVIGEKGREAAELCPEIDRILELKRITSPLSNLRLAAELASRRADILIDLNSAYSRASTALTRMAKASVKLSFEKRAGNAACTHRLPMPADTEHMLDRYARLASALDAPYDPALRVTPARQAMDQARTLLSELSWDSPAAGPLVAVHPGNFKKFENRWPEEKFVELTDRLLDRRGVRVLYFTGPGEERPVREIVARLRRPVPILPPLPLSTTAALLSCLDLLIVNATGTAHLAAAVGTPTFTFLSRYTQTVWMPRSGPHASVVSRSWESCRDISVDAAWTALNDVLERLPLRSGPAQQRPI